MRMIVSRISSSVSWTETSSFMFSIETLEIALLIKENGFMAFRAIR